MLIIIPAYNEQDALGGVLREIQSLDVRDLEIVVVDDGSSDRTAEVAHAAGARVLRLCRNLGIGGAVQSGLRLARREGFECAVQIDGDGQHPPHELHRLLAAARGPDGPDLIVGTRYGNREASAEADQIRFRSTVMRRVGSWWLRWILRAITGVPVTDPTSGFRLYGARALALFDETYPYDFPEPESLAIARVAGLRITEVPVTMRERQGGTSSISSMSAPYYMLKVTFAILLTYLRARRRPKQREIESDT